MDRGLLIKERVVIRGVQTTTGTRDQPFHPERRSDGVLHAVRRKRREPGFRAPEPGVLEVASFLCHRLRREDRREREAKGQPADRTHLSNLVRRDGLRVTSAPAGG